MGAAFSTIESERRSFSLIWLSGSFCADPQNEVEQKQSSIEQILRDHLGSTVNDLKIFADAHQCETHVRRKKHERIILVSAYLSSNQIETLVSSLHDLHQCHSVYILNTIDENYQFPGKFSKVSRSIISILHLRYLLSYRRLELCSRICICF